jgi:hypothetical protein
MSDWRIGHGPGTLRLPDPSPSVKPGTERAEDYFYPMPTVEEVVAAGYEATYWNDIKREHDELLARFDADPVFRAQVIARKEAESPGTREGSAKRRPRALGRRSRQRP